MRACRLTAVSHRAVTLASVMQPWRTVSRRWASEKAEAEAEKEGAEGAKAGEAAAEEQNAKVAELEKKLEKSTKDAAEFKEKWAYAAADADNARRIAKIDIDKARDFSVSGIAKDMLEVVDTLSRAIEAFSKLDEETTKKAAPVLTGVKMSHQVLVHNLGRHGIEKIDVKRGSKFDPNLHEALFKAPITEGVKAEEVAAVVKDGYTIKGRVLRAAQVGVAEEELLQ